MKRYTVGISGASGACYGVRLVELLARAGADVALTVTAAGLLVLRDEAGLVLRNGQPVLDSLWPDREVLQRVTFHPADRFDAPPASGSTPSDGMTVCPCSMNTLAALACGLAGNLLQRAAQVAIKERRPLVLVPRETPLAGIHIESMLRLERSGARIVPAMPGFYHRPQSVADLVDFVVAKVLDALGAEHDIAIRWSPDGE